MEPRSQSGSTRTSAPLWIACRTLNVLDAAIPSPATALATTPSLIVTVSWLSTRTEVSRPSLRNDNVGDRCAGPTITAWCAEQGALADDVQVARRSLEDVFLELTGRELRE